MCSSCRLWQNSRRFTCYRSLRGRALARPLDEAGLRRLFLADTMWGVAALLWISTGLVRAFGGLEKGSEFYLASPLF